MMLVQYAKKAARSRQTSAVLDVGKRFYGDHLRLEVTVHRLERYIDL